MPLTV